jgi:hypothetical protein
MRHLVYNVQLLRSQCLKNYKTNIYGIYCIIIYRSIVRENNRFGCGSKKLILKPFVYDVPGTRVANS